VPSDYVDTTEQFFRDLGGTGLYGILTQYYEGSRAHRRHIHNHLTYGGAVLSTEPFPGGGVGSCTVQHNCVQDGTVQNLIRNAMGSAGWTGGLDQLYVVFVAPGETVCRGARDCYPSPGCAFHDYFSQGFAGTGDKVVYAVIPEVGGNGEPSGSNCLFGGGPHSSAADVATSFASHETMEAVTDPLGDGWQFPDGTEIGDDPCQTDIGDRPPIYDSGHATERLFGHDYLLQTEWSNDRHKCVRNDGGEHILEVVPTPDGGSPTGPPRTSVAIGGETFKPGERVKIKYKTGLAKPKSVPLGPGCTDPSTSTQARGDGSFVCTVLIPGAAKAGAAGKHKIVAIGKRSHRKLVATFHLIDQVASPSTVHINASCDGSGELCNPPVSLFSQVVLNGDAHMTAHASAGHCSDVAFHYLVDGTPANSTGFLAPDGSETVTVPIAPAGRGHPHDISVQAEGRTGGCNQGTLGAWQADFTLTP
jgi:hypothetical protein